MYKTGFATQMHFRTDLFGLIVSLLYRTSLGMFSDINLILIGSQTN